jgi:TPR repeat protein
MLRPFLLVFVAITCGALPRAAHAQEPSDVEQALARAHARALDGDVVAQFTLGSVLYYGGTDLPQAVKWFRAAASQQYPPAEFQLGQLHDFGFGVEEDASEALRWYRRAASGGSAPAQRAVGDFYRKGRGVRADATEAARWYLRAAEADDIQAQYQVGQMYFDGSGVERDYESAYVWFALAASQAPLIDNRKAIVELRNIAAVRMAPGALDSADRRVAAWSPSVWPQAAPTSRNDRR